MGITEFLVEHIVRFIDAGGYPSIVLLMALESMIAPVPSEAVMPFAGFLISAERFSFLGVTLASSVGSIIGSVASYFMGSYGGRPFVTRYGKYLLLSEKDLAWTERFMEKYGPIAVFFGRFVPVVRHLISIPAGVGRMRFVPFLVYTLVGATMWNMFLAWLGYTLEQHWELIGTYSGPIDAVVVGLIIIGIGFFVWSHLRRR